MGKIITAALSAGALVLPLAACSSGGTASVPSSAATVSIPAPESSAQQMIQMACSQLKSGTQAVRSATSANISDALGALYGDISGFAGGNGGLSGKIGTDFNTLIGDLKTAFTNDGTGPHLTGPVAPIQAALNQALADC